MPNPAAPRSLVRLLFLLFCCLPALFVVGVPLAAPHRGVDNSHPALASLHVQAEVEPAAKPTIAVAPGSKVKVEATVVIPGMPRCCYDAPVPQPSPASSSPTPLPSPLPAVQTAPAGGGGRVVAVDPGHGGNDTGAVSATGITEKSVNLKIALKLADLLRAHGYTPVLTRSSDRAVNTDLRDLNGDGMVNNDDDLQARVDVANAANADILVSIHNDSENNSAVRGTTVYVCDSRLFALENRRLAQALEGRLVAAIDSTGYSSPERGVLDDGSLRKPYGHLFLLGPATPRTARPSRMPGALGETLYLSNPADAAQLARDSVLSAIAEGYYRGIADYFAP